MDLVLKCILNIFSIMGSKYSSCLNSNENKHYKVKYLSIVWNNIRKVTIMSVTNYSIVLEMQSESITKTFRKLEDLKHILMQKMCKENKAYGLTNICTIGPRTT